MNSRQRFQETMGYGKPDRVPQFEEGLRKDVLKAWRKQGLKRDSDLSKMFTYDKREEIEPDLDPRPPFKQPPSSLSHLDALQRRLDPDDLRRLPPRWNRIVRAWQYRDHILMLRIHHGFFLSMGVDGWKRFRQVCCLLIKDPEFVREAMAIQGRFAARLAERILQHVEIDAAVFVEPIAENRGPLISPRMYEEFVLKSYEPILDVLRRSGIKTIILLTFANTRILIPSLLKWGFNCLWACEVEEAAMDYRELRREFGRDLRLIGGIDLDALRQGKAAIRREIEEKVPPLLDGGGYIPLVDGRIREDVSFENYLYYRRLLEKVIRGEN